MTPIGGPRAGIVGSGGAIPDSGVARWTYDNADTSGSTAIDVWGGNDATITGATIGATGVSTTYDSGESYSFDGSDDYVQTTGVSPGDSFSVATWIYPLSSSSTVFRNDNSNGFQLAIRFNDEIGINAGDISATDFGTISYNTAYHTVLTVENTGTDSYDIVLYMDGSQFGSASITTGNLPPTDIRFGEAYSGNPFDGRLDDPRVYSKVLTATEASNLYNTGSI